MTFELYHSGLIIDKFSKNITFKKPGGTFVSKPRNFTFGCTPPGIYLAASLASITFSRNSS